MAEAHRTAEKLVSDAEGEGSKARAEAEQRARGLIQDASATADGVRSEGMELVSNLREMADSLRSNAERLLRDIQRIHASMMSDLDRVMPGVAGEGGPEASTPSSRSGSVSGEELDVPEFIPRE